MFNIKPFLQILFCFTLVSSCAVQPYDDGDPQFDFDHQVQFRQTTLSENKYHLTIVPSAKRRFNRLATFLLRRSKDICHNYGYKIEILEGVQGYNEAIGAPNKIMGSLSANIECLAPE